MGKKRVYEFAKEINTPSKQVVDAAEKAGLSIKNHMAMIDDAGQSKVRQILQKGTGAAPAAKQPAAAAPAQHQAPKPKSQNMDQKDPHTGKTKILVSAIRRPKSKPNAAHASVHGVKTTTGVPREDRHALASRRNAERRQPAVNAAPAKPQESRRPTTKQTAAPTNAARPIQSTNRQESNPTVSTTQAKPTTTQKTPTASARNQQTSAPRNQSAQSGSRSTNQSGQNTPSSNRGQSQNRNQNQGGGNRSQGQNRGQSQSRPSNQGQGQNRNQSQNRSQNSNQNRNTSAGRSAQPVATATTTESGNRDSRRNRNQGSGNNNYRGNNNSRFNDNRNGGNRRNRRNKKGRRRENEHKKVMPQRKDRPLPETLVYTEGMNAQELGKVLHREPAEIVKKLFMLGVMVNQNQSLDDDTIELLAADYNINAKKKVEQDISDLDALFEKEQENTDHLVPRPPVVTIMGHVDHGKTTLLDKLRHTHVTEGEAGGITQHIGAYQTKLDGRVITFLDTPGHAAFTEMRARGADVTDIIILVVAADDGVMPQTIEAINHAKAAHAPMIVAVNKIDKPGANPNHVMEQLTEYGLIPEDWGGDTIFVQISAKYGKNLDELLEMILLQADVMELKANPDQPAVGTVLEAKLDKGRGPVASLLVQQGTLKIGDPIVVGDTFGKVRVMTNDRGRRIKEALPAEPVEITGLNDVPNAADHFVVFPDEKTARAVGEERQKNAQVEERAHNTHVTLDNLFETMKEEQMKEVDVIIKADVQGSVQALADSLQKINVKGVRVNIIHQAVGAINESDVTLAAASNAIIIGFNVRPTPQARAQADTDNVDIRLHRVIYKAIDEVESAMKGKLEPEYQEKVTGNLQVREIYNVSKVGTIAGCLVTDGLITRDSGVRLIRDGIVVHEGKLGSLKRFKDDVKEVRQGFDCGLTIDGYNDIHVDDQIEAYVMEEVPVQ
ncbi:translation initiation factor IF-2 [Schleiferilactobacillus shenzhenensis]|uniref:Translation initiation factor IF-2 n=1 Tax=Schleiferilactobacillus shenzhenensis LY-73 TaxID=1231336 RepID=U4TJY2_9LACO|nr:translation initiation factor IF-2 [Schleiferilactobacillus shenzhenensis]ERL64499.1 InfB [Schleiferilactobacillus shenzhenensis LY-73]